MSALARVTLFVAGSMASFCAGFFLLGGPDGAILSRNSLLFGIPTLMLAALLIHASAKPIPVKAYVFAPVLVSIVAWLLAFALSQHAGFYVWLIGVPVSAIAGLAYRVGHA